MALWLPRRTALGDTSNSTQTRNGDRKVLCELSPVNVTLGNGRGGEGSEGTWDHRTWHVYEKTGVYRPSRRPGPSR